MSFQPIIPLAGYSGWRFLQRTSEAQQDAFTSRPDISRDTEYFREKIGDIKSAEDLVSDRQLLRVALGAFGLSDDINSKFFIQKILEEGTIESDALANRLSDSRYRNFSEAFGFGDIGGAGHTVRSDFADDIISRFEDGEFQIAVGNQNENLRLAMNFSSSLQDISEQSTTVDSRWFNVMGNPPLRRVVETALGLPSAIASIDIDQQLESFKEKSNSLFGTDDPADFLSDENSEQMIRLFLIRAEASNLSSTSSGSVALTLLSNIAS